MTTILLLLILVTPLLSQSDQDEVMLCVGNYQTEEQAVEQLKRFPFGLRILRRSV